MSYCFVVKLNVANIAADNLANLFILLAPRFFKIRRIALFCENVATSLGDQGVVFHIASF
jgi:hypothetical protein